MEKILKELWTKEVNIPEVKTSYEYVTELREHLEDSLKLVQEELQKSQKRYKKQYAKKAKSRRLEIGDQVLILLPTNSNKLLIQWRGPYTMESRVGVDVVHTSNKDDVTIAVAGVIYQDTDLILLLAPDLYLTAFFSCL